jgi:plastocyanin
MKLLRWVATGLALVIGISVSSHAALHTVDVNSGSFSPSNIEIDQGDQIKWQLVNGTHTTTSNTGLWDEPINSSNPSFTRTFNSIGTFPYRCTPHQFTGQIKVVAPSGIFDDPSSEGDLPNLIALRQNSPNPFNAATQIEYSLDKDGFVQLAVYNILGQEVATLIDGFQPGGLHTVTWDGRNDHGNETPSGIYFARLTTLGVMMTRKMVLLR